MAELKKAVKKTLDMSNVKDRGPFNPKHVESGGYVAKITAVYASESKSGNEMWVFAFQPTDKRDAVYPYYCLLDPDNLWKIRNVAEAAGIAVPKKRIALDPNKLVGKTVGIELEDDEYDGKMKSVITQVMPQDQIDGDDDAEDEPEEDLDDDEEEEEPPAKATKRKAAGSRVKGSTTTPAKRKRKPELEPEEDDDEEDVDDEDLDELDVEDL